MSSLPGGLLTSKQRSGETTAREDITYTTTQDRGKRGRKLDGEKSED